MITTDIFLRRAVAQKAAPFAKDFFALLLVQCRSLRLVKRPLVPIDAQPLQPIQNALHEFGLVALGVGIFDAKDHGAALSAREQPVKQRGPRSSHVQIAGG